MPDRNRVRVESNQRIDKPDFEALQLGAHLAVRYAVRGLLFGTDASDQTVVTSAWTLTGAGSLLTVSPGRAVAGETMVDATVEQGHVIGEDGDASQSIDFVGYPADTYFVYARVDYAAGVSGSRIFWNASTEEEDAAAIDTREVSGWKLAVATSSPGTGYAQVGTAVWDGGAFTSVVPAGLHFWEGMLNSSGVESSNQWGDGANDRNANRALYGVQSLFKAAALVRRQLKDIIGAASGHWGSAVPTSLTAAKAHIDLTTNPHGAAPTWTGKPVFNGGIDVNGQVDARGSGYVSVDAKGDLRFDTTQEGEHNVPGIAAAAYITNGASFTTIGWTDGGQGRLNNSGTGTMNLVVPLHIPLGATLTRVDCVGYWENQAGATSTISLEVWSNSYAFLAYVTTKLGDASEDDTTLSGGAIYGSPSVTGLSSQKTTLKSHFAYIRLVNNGETAKLSLAQVIAYYEFDSVVG